PSRTPSLRLLADQTARALIGIARALDGVALLADPGRRIPATRPARFQVADWLPALVSAARAFVTIAALELLWIVTEWPNGTGAITFAAVILLLFSPRAEEAYAIAVKFMAGTLVATVIAALIKFAVLPGMTSFPGLSLAIGLVLVPAGAMIVLPWQPGLFLAVMLLVAALAVGREIIRLRRAARRLKTDSELDAALAALARGDSAAAGERLARLAARLAALPGAAPGAQLRLRVRGSILAVMEALTQHAAYFDAEAAR
ncbi:MAG: hypothetical protein JWQ17_5499, partial [Tardiphaga sp.]|nr:hypothetical protein [Tardiphaga sp.]